MKRESLKPLRAARYARAWGNGGARRFLLVKLVPALGLLGAVFAGQRRRSALIGLAAYPAALGIFGKGLLRQPVVRREDLETRQQDVDALELRFRNPRWARVWPAAAVPGSGYDPLTAVDGTPQLLERLRIESDGCVVASDAAALEIWLIPFATYHVDEFGPVLKELVACGARAGFVFASYPTTAQLEVASTYTDRVYVADDQFSHSPAVALTTLDWGLAQAVVDRLKRSGTKILSKVEGAQDFKNLDTPRWPLPYTNSTCVLAQGAFDATNVAATEIEVVGSVRLERLLPLIERNEIESVAHGPLLNLNFSYGANGVWLRPWYWLAQRGFVRAGLRAQTSVHPAVLAPFVGDQTKWPLALELEISSHLVTRCSTALFDALLLGRPAIYFNPQRERVWDRIEWDDVVPQVRTPTGLARQLGCLDPANPDQIDARMAFVRRTFIEIDPAASAAQRTAAAILRWV